MREILFRGKDDESTDFVYGLLSLERDCRNPKMLCTVKPCIVWRESELLYSSFVIPETIGRYTGLTDKNGKKIFEGDIVQYLTYDDFDCQSVVKFGEYKQDGSSGEYGARICLGFYVEVDNFTCPDWCENEPECFSDYQKQQNILEIANECEVIGNIYDNPELLEGDKDNG